MSGDHPRFPTWEDLDALRRAREAARTAEAHSSESSLDPVARLGFLIRETIALLGEPLDSYHEAKLEGMRCALEVLCSPDALLDWEKRMREQKTQRKQEEARDVG